MSESGHLVLARIPDGASFTARFTDDTEARDLTDHAADLLLSGALATAEQQQSGQPAPAQEVQAATVTYVEPQAAPGQPAAPASFTWVHLPSREGGDFPPGDVLAVLAAGLSFEITSAVAAESADVPDDPSTLAGPA